MGSYRGHAGEYKSIQAAVNAAKPGDWILIAPGDYRETDTAAGVTKTEATSGDYGGVVIHTSDLHLRGMNRSRTIVDGTKSGAPCSAAAQNQNFGTSAGRNGIVVFKADNVSIQNLTACNFLAGKGSSGNAIWWNGGAGSGKVGLHGYTGQYLTATSSVLRHREPQPPRTASSRRTPRAGRGTTSTPTTSTTRACTWGPASRCAQ